MIRFNCSHIGSSGMIDGNPIRFGLDTFGDITVDEHGKPVPAHQVLRNVEEAVLAVNSSASSTSANTTAMISRSRAGTWCWPPCRAYQAYPRPVRLPCSAATTPDACLRTVCHAGRPLQRAHEVILGRGSFIESFPLFGFDLQDYEPFRKLDLFTKLLSEKPVTWSGKTRAPLNNQRVYPPTPVKHPHVGGRGRYAAKRCSGGALRLAMW